MMREHLNNTTNVRALRRGMVVLAAIGCILLRGVWPSRAQDTTAGTIQNAVGAVVVVRADGIELRAQGKNPLQLFAWDMVRTEAASQVLIETREGVQIALNENTIVKILDRWEKDKGTTRIFRLQEGELWAKTGAGPKPLEVETPVATAAIRETEFNIKVLEDGQTILTVIEGVVEFGTAFGTCPIRPSTMSYGVRGKRCTKPEPTDAKPVTAWTSSLLK
jgi:hypothetical protein